MEIQVTDDGSHTLFNTKLNETYHSKFGAIEESNYVFLEKGLCDYIKLQQKSIQIPLQIFEIGYGTGLNALIFANYATQNKLPIHYTGIEILPVPTPILQQLNYTHLLAQDSLEHYQKLNNASWNTKVQINPYFELTKIHSDIHQFNFSENVACFDLVLMDAFAPDKQPDMWQDELFCNLFSIQKPGGILVTYTSKGAVKRSLIEAGYVVEKLPGPPMKRHMLRAAKPLQNETI